MLNLIRAQATTYYLPVLISVRSWNVFRPVIDSALDCGAITVVRLAGLFYKGSAVKMLDAKSFKKAMRENVCPAFVRNASF